MKLPCLRPGPRENLAVRWLVLQLAALCAVLVPARAMPRELLAVSTHFENVYERDADGAMVGLGPEIIRLIARRMGHTVRFEMLPWVRAQALVAQGKADILVGPYRTAERQRFMAFSRLPFFQDQLVFYARTDNVPPWRGDYAALQAQRIVILNGWAYGAAFDQARPALQLSISNSVESGLRMVAHRHVQLFASNRRDTDPVLARLGLVGQVISLPVPIDRQDAYFAFPQDSAHDALRQAFDVQFQRLVDSGDWRKLLQRHAVAIP